MEIRPLQTRLDCCWSISAAFHNFPFERPQYQGLSQLLPQVSLPLNFQHFRRLSSRIVMISRSGAHAVSRNVATFQRHTVSQCVNLQKFQKTDLDHNLSHYNQSNLSMCYYVNTGWLFQLFLPIFSTKMKNDGQPISDSVPWNSRCTKDPHWLDNVFLFSSEIWAEQ